MASLDTVETTSSTGMDTVVGYFSNTDDAHAAFHALQQAGFSSNQIGLAARSASTSDTPVASSSSAKSSEPGVWDKVKNFFDGGKEAEPYAGEATGNSLDDREITSGGYDVRDSLSGLSVPDQHSRYFSHRFSQADEGTVLTVTAAGRADEARAILEENGADLGEGADSYAYPEESTEALDTKVANEQNIRLYGEVLRVHKDRISAGEVRLRKEVITEVQTVEVPVTREELVIERVSVTGDEAATGATFSGEEIRIPLSQEIASVDKHAVVREEVRVGKRDVTDIESLDETVRREELKIEDETIPATEYAKR